MAFYKHIPASANGLKTNDVIEDWRHWLAVALSRPSTVGPILFIASGKILLCDSVCTTGTRCSQEPRAPEGSALQQLIW